MKPIPALAVALLAFACNAAPTLSVGVPEDGGLTALAVIEEDAIRADLEFIADDELGGRDTPSEGLRIAARFLRARLERLGWQPGAEDGWFYEYDLQRKQMDAEGTRAELVKGERAVALELGTDWLFSARNLEEQDREAALVWMGGGSKEDFEDADVEDKVVLLRDGEGSWWGPYRRAQRAEALGVVWLAGEEDDAPFADSWEDWKAELAEGTVGWPADAVGSPGQGSFNSATLSRAGEARLLELHGSTPEVGDELSVRLRDRRAIDPDSPRIPVENVCGFWPGDDPELADEVILVTAHYDHVGTRGDEIYNGADDNGSGTVALLAIAEALVEHGPLRRSVMLMWVSGEEKGLLGARAWALDPWLPEDTRAVCNINIDMVGRNAPDQILVTPTSEHEAYNGLTKLVEELAPLEGITDIASADAYYHRSDHAMFEEHMGLPVCFLFSDVHEDYHQPTDTVDKVDFDKIRRVTRLVLRMLAGLQEDELGV